MITLVVIGSAAGLTAAEQEQPTSPRVSLAQRRAALISAVATNCDYAEEWLTGGDFKTLDQTANGMILLSLTLSTLDSDPKLQELAFQLRDHAQGLVAAATKQDKQGSQRMIDTIKQWSKQAEMTKFPEVPTPPREGARARVPIGPMMALLDGTYADAKRALIFDDVAQAKTEAVVLAELGELLSHAKEGDKWEQLAADFQTAAWQVATTKETSAKSVRTLLSGVYQRCTACHDRR